MKRREARGLVLIVLAAALAWWGNEVWGPSGSGAAGRRLVFYFHGITEDSVTGWAVMISIITGVTGVLMLIPSLIRRIHRRWLRISIMCLSTAAALPAAAYLALAFVFSLLLVDTSHYTRLEASDGRSVLLAVSPFDPNDGTSVYTGYDAFHYALHEGGAVFSGLPLIRDRHCRLDAAEEVLLLTCGPDAVTIIPR